QDAGAGEGVHQSALARVRVADERNGMLLAAAEDLALLADLDDGQALLEIANLELDEPAIFFELRLAGTAEADAALVARQVRPHLAQPRQGVFELRQLHLQPGLHAA